MTPEQIKKFDEVIGTALTTGRPHTDKVSATLFKTSDGFTPEKPDSRTGTVRPPFTPLLNALAANNRIETWTSGGAPTYRIEKVNTDAGAVKAEGTATGEGDVEYTQTNVSLETIRHMIPFTEEEVEDAPEAIGYLRNTAITALRELMEGRAVGVLQATANKAVDAKAANNNWAPRFTDAISGGRAKVAESKRLATHMAMHPMQWGRELGDGTALTAAMVSSNRYGFMDIIQSVHYANPAGSSAGAKDALFGNMFDINSVTMFVHGDIDVSMEHNAGDFSKYQRTLRVAVRAKLVIHRPAGVVGLYTAAA